MKRLVMLVRFKDQATPPEGDPPKFTVHGESEQVTLLDGDRSALPDAVKYDTEVRVTGETSFDEDGVVVLGGDADRLRISTVGQGFLAPSAEEGLHHGSVIWRVDQGEGALAGATGLISSNFMVRMETGEATESQVVALFLP
jgi:hypothetical protein